MPIRRNPTQPTAILCAAALALAAGHAHAQDGSVVSIEIARPVLAPGESTTVRLWADYDSTRDYAMGVVVTSLLADVVGAGGLEITDAWSDVDLVTPFRWVGSTPGTPDAGGYAGIIAGQFHWWQDPAATDRSDPIAFWEATFTAPTDAGAFIVDLSTLTTRFEVWVSEDSSRIEPRMDGLTEGAGRITVVPAPASTLVLIGLVAHRRRR